MKERSVDQVNPSARAMSTISQDDWWGDLFQGDVSDECFSEKENLLISRYELSTDQQRVLHAVNQTRNIERIPAEELVWNIGVCSAGGDVEWPQVYKTVLERVSRFEEAERKYGWVSGEWTPELMRLLIRNWYCGMMVIVPGVVCTNGSPLMFVHEYYAYAPLIEDQDDAYIQQTIDLFVRQTRSICKSYPTATTKGLVSFSDFTHFDHDRYDMHRQKMEHAEVGAYIPSKLVRMIATNTDEKMNKLYSEYPARMLKKWGLAQYDGGLSDAIENDEYLPSVDVIPQFMGGNSHVNILECLQHLLSQEPEALKLLESVHEEMRVDGELPNPEYMGQGE